MPNKIGEMHFTPMHLKHCQHWLAAKQVNHKPDAQLLTV
jgi:hypothetical protein